MPLKLSKRTIRKTSILYTLKIVTILIERYTNEQSILLVQIKINEFIHSIKDYLSFI
jgi:hypothetical protein